MNSENKLLLARIQDVFRLCEKYQRPVFSQFLDGAQQACVEDCFDIPYGYNVLFCGGFEGAERKIMGVFPDWHEAAYDEFPITAVKIEGGFKRALTHRDYLGSIMSLGIDRQKTGDILTFDKGAYVFLSAEISDYVIGNIRKIGHEGVKITQIPCSEVKIPQREFQRIQTVCASLRLDAVTAACCNISRKEAAELVRGGMVKVNYREQLDGAKNINDGDLLSVRGFGRFVFAGGVSETRKGRLHINIDKFI